MLVTWRVLAVVISLPLAVGCVANGTGEPEAQSSEESVDDYSDIVTGTPSTDVREDAVVDLWLQDNGGWATCTGSLIAPNVVLTAYHCVAREMATGDARCPSITSGDSVYTEHSAIYEDHLAAKDIFVSLSRERGSASDMKFVAHGSEIVDNAARVLCSNDIAVVVLDRPITTVAPLKIRGTAAQKGEKLAAIGWGKLDDNGAAKKERTRREGIKVLALEGEIYRHTRQDGAKLVEAAYAGEFITGTATCHGDSGGPLLDSQHDIVGVASRGSSTGGCVDVLKTFTDVSHHIDLIQQGLDVGAAKLQLATADTN